MKLCKDCTHRIPADHEDEDASIRFSKCRLAVDKKHESIAVGWKPKDHDDFRFCSTERRFGWLESRVFGNCGREGRFWEVA